MLQRKLEFEPYGDALFLITSTHGGHYGSLDKDSGSWVCNFGNLDIDAEACREIADKLDELNDKNPT